LLALFSPRGVSENRGTELFSFSCVRLVLAASEASAGDGTAVADLCEPDEQPGT
jgi:hypothetical protein